MKTPRLLYVHTPIYYLGKQSDSEAPWRGLISGEWFTLRALGFPCGERQVQRKDRRSVVPP